MYCLTLSSTVVMGKCLAFLQEKMPEESWVQIIVWLLMCVPVKVDNEGSRIQIHKRKQTKL